MARRFWKRYYKKKYGSYSKLKMSRNFKASASNMTQRGKFNISVHVPCSLTVSTGTQFAMGDIDIAAAISSSDMHSQLSNVFDQYKISKVSLRIRPTGNNISAPNSAQYSQTFFTVVDRTGFSANVTLAQLRTYQSYREIVWGVASSDTPTPLVVNLANTSLVEKSNFANTKSTSGFPVVKAGVWFPSNAGTNITLTYTVEIDAQVVYRGVRLDTSSVSTRVNTSS